MMKLNFSRLAVRKKITLIIILAAAIFFILNGTAVYLKVRSYAYQVSKESIQLKLELLSTKLTDEITSSYSLLNGVSDELSRSFKNGNGVTDSTAISWLENHKYLTSGKTIFITISNQNIRNTYALDESGRAFHVTGEIKEGISSANLNDGVNSLLTSATNGNSYLKFYSKSTDNISVGVLVPFSKFGFEGDVKSKCAILNANGEIVYNNLNIKPSTPITELLPDIKGGVSLSKYLSETRFITIGSNKYVAACNEQLDAKTGIAVVVFDDKSDVFKGFSLFVLFFVFGIIGLIVGYLLILNFLKQVFKPIAAFLDVLGKVANGQISENLKVSSKHDDEIGKMADSVNLLIDNLNETARFATEIGKGNLSCDFKPSSENDKLGLALLEMQSSLVKAKDLEETQKAANKKSHWSNEGMAKFSEILRNNHDNLKEMSFDVVRNLVKYVDAIQGGIFVLNDDSEEEKYLEMTACFAYNRRKMLQKRLEIGEGLVGRCYFERQTILLAEIPSDYLEITSGLGHENPRHLLLVPLKLNEDVNGVLEIASFNAFEEYQIQFIEKIAESISSTITSVRVNERTSYLLNRSQEQAELMAAQEEEMRQNLEELQATQEELEKRAKENDQINKDLEKEKYLLDALLSNIPDFIYFKDQESRFIRVSESMAPLFKVRSSADLIGKSDFDFHEAENAQRAYNEEQNIIKTGHRIIDDVVNEKWDDGREQWVSTTKMPLVASDGRIVGTFGISKVITNIKKMEIEVQAQNTEMKKHLSKMEEITEANENLKNMYTRIIDNLPLKVFVKNHEGKLVLVNSAVAEAHGVASNELIGKSDFDFYDYNSAKEIFDAEKKVVNGEVTSYIHEENFEGHKKVLKTTKMPFYIDTVKEKGLLGVQVDVSEFAKIKEQHETME